MKSNSKTWRWIVCIFLLIIIIVLFIAICPDPHTQKSYVPFYGSVIVPDIVFQIALAIFVFTFLCMFLLAINNKSRAEEGCYYTFKDVENDELFVITMMRPGHTPGSETTYSMAVRFPNIQDAEYLLCVDKKCFSEVPVRGVEYVKSGDKIITYDKWVNG